MANITFVDCAKFTAASAGTGSFVVSAAVTGYQTPATAGATAGSYRYRAESADLTQWEYGTSVYTTSNVTFTRTPVLNSVGGTSAINFTVAPQVGLVLLKEDFSATGQIPGTTTNDSATAGNIGQEINSGVVTSSNLTSGSPWSVTTTTLSPGDWDVSGQVYFLGAGGPTVNTIYFSVSTSSNSIAAGVNGALMITRVSSTVDYQDVMTMLPTRVSIASSTNYYGNIRADFTGGTYAGQVQVRARRMR